MNALYFLSGFLAIIAAATLARLLGLVDWPLTVILSPVWVPALLLAIGLAVNSCINQLCRRFTASHRVK